MTSKKEPQKENQTAEDDRFGLCPDCGQEGLCVSVGRAHYFICEHDQTCWFSGENLFSFWRDQIPAERESALQLVQSYRLVTPLTR